MLVKYLVFCALILWLGSSASALQCWQCFRTAREYPSLMRDTCRVQTCPAGFNCIVEIYKGKTLKIYQRIHYKFRIILNEQVNPPAVAHGSLTVETPTRHTVESATKEIYATLNLKSFLNTSLTTSPKDNIKY